MWSISWWSWLLAQPPRGVPYNSEPILELYRDIQVCAIKAPLAIMPDAVKLVEYTEPENRMAIDYYEINILKFLA